MARILAVDPGKMTGWGVLEGEDPYFGELGFEEFPDWASDFLAMRSGYQVVVERFVISGGTLTTARGDELEYRAIGVLRFLSRRHGHVLTLQGAGDAKRFGTDRLLRKLDWWTPGSDHARDAARHLALALARVEPSNLDARLLSSEQ